MQTESNSPRILVFDSGVGGLTVAREISALLPDVRLVYACDNAYFPYGTKGEEDLLDRVDRVVGAMVDRFAPDLIVVACNTASTLALPRLREKTAIPVVGVVPAIKPAAERSRTRVFGLLATPGTVRRTYTQSLIDRFAPDCVVVRVGSAELVAMAERKLRGLSVDRRAIRAILEPFFGAAGGEGADRRLDTVVLACTHFPLLKEELAAVAPPETTWIDSGQAVARRVRSLLGAAERGIARAAAPIVHRAVFTGTGPESDGQIEAFRRSGFSEAEVLPV